MLCWVKLVQKALGPITLCDALILSHVLLTAFPTPAPIPSTPANLPSALLSLPPSGLLLAAHTNSESVMDYFKARRGFWLTLQCSIPQCCYPMIPTQRWCTACPDVGHYPAGRRKMIEHCLDHQTGPWKGRLRGKTGHDCQATCCADEGLQGVSLTSVLAEVYLQAP